MQTIWLKWLKQQVSPQTRAFLQWPNYRKQYCLEYWCPEPSPRAGSFLVLTDICWINKFQGFIIIYQIFITFLLINFETSTSSALNFVGLCCYYFIMCDKFTPAGYYSSPLLVHIQDPQWMSKTMEAYLW